MGNPETFYASVHVTGTNGKGSVVHKIAAVFKRAGISININISIYQYIYIYRIHGGYIYVSTYCLLQRENPIEQ